MTFRLEGLPELEAALAEVASRSTQIAITRRALRKAAEPMRAKAEQYAPIGDTGALSSSIRISATATGEVGRAAYAMTMQETGDRVAALSAMRAARSQFRAENPAAILYMGPTRDTAWYGKWVEFGTSERFHANGKSVGKVTPDPFMRPAFDSEAEPTIGRLAELMWDEINRHAARMAKRAAKG